MMREIVDENNAAKASSQYRFTAKICPQCGYHLRDIDVTWCSEAVSAYGGHQYYCSHCDKYWLEEDKTQRNFEPIDPEGFELIDNEDKRLKGLFE